MSTDKKQTPVPGTEVPNDDPAVNGHDALRAALQGVPAESAAYQRALMLRALGEEFQKQMEPTRAALAALSKEFQKISAPSAETMAELTARLNIKGMLDTLPKAEEASRNLAQAYLGPVARARDSLPMESVDQKLDRVLERLANIEKLLRDLKNGR